MSEDLDEDDLPDLPEPRSRKQTLIHGLIFLASGVLSGLIFAYFGGFYPDTVDWLEHCFRNGVRFGEMIEVLGAIASRTLTGEGVVDRLLPGIFGGLIIGGLITSLVCLTWRRLDCVLGTTLFWGMLALTAGLALHVTLSVVQRSHRWTPIMIVVPAITGAVFGLLIGLFAKLLRWAFGVK